MLLSRESSLAEREARIMEKEARLALKEKWAAELHEREKLIHERERIVHEREQRLERLVRDQEERMDIEKPGTKLSVGIISRSVFDMPRQSPPRRPLQENKYQPYKREDD